MQSPRPSTLRRAGEHVRRRHAGRPPEQPVHARFHHPLQGLLVDPQSPMAGAGALRRPAKTLAAVHANQATQIAFSQPPCRDSEPAL